MCWHCLFYKCGVIPSLFFYHSPRTDTALACIPVPVLKNTSCLELGTCINWGVRPVLTLASPDTNTNSAVLMVVPMTLLPSNKWTTLFKEYSNLPQLNPFYWVRMKTCTTTLRKIWERSYQSDRCSNSFYWWIINVLILLITYFLVSHCPQFIIQVELNKNNTAFICSYAIRLS